MTGNIRNIRDDRDFAFIISGNNRDIFLHKQQFLGDWESLRALWAKGPVELEFDILESPKGLRAVNCKLKES